MTDEKRTWPIIIQSTEGLNAEFLNIDEVAKFFGVTIKWLDNYIEGEGRLFREKYFVDYLFNTDRYRESASRQGVLF
jgi:hypothetical protein